MVKKIGLMLIIGTALGAVVGIISSVILEILGFYGIRDPFCSIGGLTAVLVGTTSGIFGYIGYLYMGKKTDKLG